MSETKHTPDLLDALKKAESFIRATLAHSIPQDLFDSEDEYRHATENHVTLKVVVAAIAKATEAEGRS